MGTTEILARHIVETTDDSPPAEVVRAASVLLAPPQVAAAEALIDTLEILPTLSGLIAVLQGGR
jgi:hypothetical protein